MITLRMLLSIVSATASGSFLMPSGSLSIAPAPRSTMSSIRPVSSKSETISRRLGLDVGVEQVAHAGFVLLEVDVLAGAELHLVADLLVVRDLVLDRLRPRRRCSRPRPSRWRGWRRRARAAATAL